MERELQQVWERLVEPTLAQAVAESLAEDLGRGDATSLALVPEGARAEGVIVARGPGRLAGGALVEAVFAQLDPVVTVRQLVADGAAYAAGAHLIALEGSARALLAGERVALNFVQRLTGIATLTAAFVERAAPHGAQILDTRKTTPRWRGLEKYAVRCGGGVNHRLRLDDRILIKDNHRTLWRQGGGETSLAAAVRAARRAYPELPIEIEVESLAELQDAAAGQPDWILLDNMSGTDLRAAVVWVQGRIPLEASGGITLETVAAVAATGVTAISVGALTHSPPAADLSLEFLL